jgi:hypothetical protein
MSERTLKLVFGYLKDIDRPNKKADSSGLSRRLAVAFDTWRSDRADMCFDSRLYLAVLSAILEAVPHDSIKIFTGSTEEYSSLSQLEQKYRSVAEDEREPFRCADVFQAGRLVGHINTVRYDAVGGPEPYHDAIVAEVFLRDLDEEKLRTKISEAAAGEGAVIKEVRRGGPAPSISLWTRVRGLIRPDFLTC